MTKLICEKCDGRFAAIYKTDLPYDVSMNAVIFHSTDMFGNNLKVLKNGQAEYTSVTSCECTKQGSKYCADYSKPHNCEDAKKKCLPAASTRNAAFRVFAMNRDLSAFEYLHQSAVEDAKKDVTLDMGSPLNCYLAAGMRDSHYQPTLSDKQIELAPCRQESPVLFYLIILISQILYKFVKINFDIKSMKKINV